MRVLTIVSGLILLAASAVLADRTPEGDAPQRMTVTLSEYRFDPARIELKAGRETELTLVNEGTVLHEFVTEGLRNVTADVVVNGVVVEALGVGELELPAKARVVLRFTPARAGAFRVTCEAEHPVPHLKEGMSAALIFR